MTNGITKNYYKKLCAIIILMNKDVIYIEPEDDITDIISKIKTSESHVVALVPPKKATVFRSAVNFKLLTKTAKDSDKHVVLITSETPLIKLAAATELPVAKNLQSRPEVPKPDPEPDDPKEENVIEGTVAKKIVVKDEDEEGKALESVDLSDDKASEEPEKGKKTKKSPKVPNFNKFRKWIIFGAVTAVLLITFLVWALVFAPAAKITVALRTSSRNFSENISFVQDAAKEDADAGIFLLEEHSITKQTSITFAATGTKDLGEKASGTLTLTRTGISSAPINIPKNTVFTLSGFKYVSLEEAVLRVPTDDDCANYSLFSGCTLLKPTITKVIKVQAESAGDSSNLAAATSGWTSSITGFTISSSAMTGGTTKVIKIVSEQDIAEAKTHLVPASESAGKAELIADFPTALLSISSSLTASTKDPVSVPKVGEEIKDDAEPPKLTQETVFMMYGVDRVKIEQYIRIKTASNLQNEADRKVYSTGVSDDSEKNKARIDQFTKTDEKITAKLKSLVQIGPEITEQQIMDKTLGKKIGEVQSQIKSINGVTSVSVETSFFWVSAIPDDPNKVSIEITIDQ